MEAMIRVLNIRRWFGNIPKAFSIVHLVLDILLLFNLSGYGLINYNFELKGKCCLLSNSTANGERTSKMQDSKLLNSVGYYEMSSAYNI